MEGRRRDESDEEQKFDGDDGVLVGEVRSALSADIVLVALELAAKIAHPPTRSVFEGLARRHLRPAHFSGLTFEEVEGWVADTYFEGDIEQVPLDLVEVATDSTSPLLQKIFMCAAPEPAEIVWETEAPIYFIKSTKPLPPPKQFEDWLKGASEDPGLYYDCGSPEDKPRFYIPAIHPYLKQLDDAGIDWREDASECSPGWYSDSYSAGICLFFIDEVWYWLRLE